MQPNADLEFMILKRPEAINLGLGWDQRIKGCGITAKGYGVSSGGDENF